MNWDYWLPWRDHSQKDRKESTYEKGVIDRCDHDFTTTETSLSPSFAEATFEEGHVVVPQYRKIEEFCENCGVSGINGKATHLGGWTEVERRLAFKPTFEMEPGLSVSEAIVEPVEGDADYAVSEEGEVTKKKPTDGSGRVLVNQSDDAGSGLTD